MKNDVLIQVKYNDMTYITELCIECHMRNAHKEKGINYILEQARARAVLGHWLNTMLAYEVPMRIVMPDMVRLRKMVFS